jgi:L-fuculose-phosphate aldolase
MSAAQGEAGLPEGGGSAAREEAGLREAIVRAGRRLAERFFVAANDGNISARISEREYLVTPSGVNKGDLAPDMLLKVDPAGTVLSGTLKPTSEMKMHLAVYRRRPDVRAIVHAHPPAATGFAACRIRLDREVVLPEVVFGLGRIGFAGYATPTTEEVPLAVEKEIGGCEALLLANHGALTVGEEVMQAYYRMETLEMYARVRLVAQLLGGPKTLEEGQVRQLQSVRQRQGWDRSAPGPADPALIETIARVVLEVLKAQGGVPGS